MTDTHVTSAFAVHAIDAGIVSDLLQTDDAGKPPRRFIASEGGAPLRCCLRPMKPGELVALVSYAPLRRWARQTGADPGPYDEVGPVFIHAGPCEGPSGSGYPADLAGPHRVLRAYSADGHILGGRLVPAGEPGDTAPAEAALAALQSDPEVVVVHTRAVEFGCFICEIRPV
jgi:hypothetical protein